MDALDLKLICSTDKILATQFKGVYAIDNLPSPVHSFPSAFICNTDKASGPGTHWVAIYFDDKKNCSYFDSYGISPGGRLKYFALNNSNGSVMFNEKWLQSLISVNCGLYVIYFLHHAARGVKLKDITGWPFVELAWGCNDSAVTEWVRHLINTPEGK